MRIRGVGVIADAVLPLGPGLTVVTGETGAGKTMVVASLALLLGGRAESSAVRTGEGSALVEGRFVVPTEGAVARRAAEAGAVLDDVPPSGAGPAVDCVELLVARSVSASGRSRAHVGGTSVPIAVLSELADDLVAVHGQSEQVLLRSPARQREVVDRFGGDAVATALSGYRTAWRRWQEVGALLTELTTQAARRAEEAERLRLGLAEVETVAPQPGEDVELRARALRLENAEDLRLAATAAREVLSAQDGDTAEASPDVAGLLEAARRHLDHVARHDDRLAELGARVGELAVQSADVAAELTGYLAGMDADPATLAAVQDRRGALNALVRSPLTGPGDSVDAVLGWAREAVARLDEIEGDDDRVEGLQRELAALDATLDELAAALRTARRAAGDGLAASVGAELAQLAMPHAQIGVRLTDRERGPHGCDEVLLVLSAHPGAPELPLGRTASGGELSRVMLALEVALAGTDPVPTFVFDEVDAGVGGRAAVQIGRRLATLAAASQVLVVTHLPQVAAFADRHLVVVRSDDGRVTSSGVTTLDDAGRVVELARMLAGQEDSASARAHAAELLEQARGG